jgi:GntR family transcriptional regulator
VVNSKTRGAFVIERKLERNLPISDQLQEILRERIRSGEYPPGSQFPSESDLAEEFEVSRITVRRACSSLVNTGLIARRWGVGTFVSKLAKITNPINQIIEFQELISSFGFKPNVKVGKAEPILADEAMAEALSVKESSRLLKVEKIFTADDDPVIVVTTFIPEWVMGDQFNEILKQAKHTEPLFTFLNDRCGQRLKNMHTEFWPDTLQGYGLELENFSPNTPVLVMNHIAYNYDEDPIYLSNQIQLGNRMRYSLIRYMEGNS